MGRNHATPVREEKSVRRKYHDSTNLLLMVSLLFALQRAENTIDDADYIIDFVVLIIIIQ